MVKPVRFVCGVGLFLSVLACGGGGASATQNQYAGTYVGTFSWNIGGPPHTGTANGTVDGLGNVNFDMYMQPAPNYNIDRILGVVSSANGVCIGDYLWGIDPPPNNTFGTYDHTSQFTLVGNQLTIEVNGSDGLGSNWDATMILTRQ